MSFGFEKVKQFFQAATVGATILASSVTPTKPSNTKEVNHNYGTGAYKANAALARLQGQTVDDAAVDKALAQLHQIRSEESIAPQGFADVKMRTREEANLANAFLLNSPEAQKMFEQHVDAAYRRHFGEAS